MGIGRPLNTSATCADSSYVTGFKLKMFENVAKKVQTKRGTKRDGKAYNWKTMIDVYCVVSRAHLASGALHRFNLFMGIRFLLRTISRHVFNSARHTPCAIARVRTRRVLSSATKASSSDWGIKSKSKKMTRSPGIAG